MSKERKTMMKAKVTGGSLRLRAYGSVSADILEVLADGSEVTVKSMGEEWSEIKINDMEGYVMTKYLRIMEESSKKGTSVKKKKKATAKKASGEK